MTERKFSLSSIPEGRSSLDDLTSPSTDKATLSLSSASPSPVVLGQPPSPVESWQSPTTSVLEEARSRLAELRWTLSPTRSSPTPAVPTLSRSVSVLSPPARKPLTVRISRSPSSPNRLTVADAIRPRPSSPKIPRPPTPPRTPTTSRSSSLSHSPNLPSPSKITITSPPEATSPAVPISPQTATSHSPVTPPTRLPAMSSVTPRLGVSTSQAMPRRSKKVPKEITSSAITSSAITSSPQQCANAACPHNVTPLQSPSTECLLEEKVHMTKKEIFNKYRLHIFVALILLIIVLFVSLGWYYKDRFQEENLAKQKVFVDPRQRLMTLSDGQDEVNVLLGQDLPQWQLPLHCSIQMEGNPNSKECEWKKNAILRVDYFLAQTQDGSSSAHCYNVSWETIRPPRVPHDCFDIGNAVWYGPSNQSAQTWPIQGSFSYSPKPSQLGNGGTFSSVADLYWLSSSGVGLLLNAENPLTLYWNNTRANYLCVVSNYTGPLYGRRQEDLLPRMNYTLCNGPNPKETHALMMPFLRGNGVLEAVPKDLFTDPHWSTKGGARKDVYNQDDVVSVVNNIRSNGLSCSVLALDGEWQTSQGDLVFDDNRFPNLTYMTELALNVCAIEIEVSPYFHYRSANFTEGVEKEFFVKDAGGEVPGLTRRKSGTAVAMLDVTKATSKSWFNTLVTKVFNRVKARAIRLSYGAEGWLPYKPNFNDPSVSLFKIRRMMAEMVSHQSDRFVLEHTSGSQKIAGLMTIPTDIKIKDGKSCLANAIERALTLGLLGYPYVMADGIRMSGTGQTVTTPSRDLFMRWMQMAAFFPAFTFSVPPWLYDDDTIALARNLSKLHSDLVVPTLFQTELAKGIAAGLPIMRPIWWLDPGNQTLHELRVSNQFLIGDGLLVAPVLCEGVTQRSVYIPAGVWDDRLRGNLVLGPRVIEAYRVEHYEVPYFVLMKTV